MVIHGESIAATASAGDLLRDLRKFIILDGQKMTSKLLGVMQVALDTRHSIAPLSKKKIAEYHIIICDQKN